jgi:hypothetical protein
MAINKRGLVRMLEVMFAITILATAIIYVYTTKAPSQSSIDDYVSVYHNQILKEISTNESLREMVLSGDKEGLEEFISLPLDLNFSVQICDMVSNPGYCNTDSDVMAYLYNNNFVYYSSEEIIIAANLDLYSPKKVRLTIWQVF